MNFEKVKKVKHSKAFTLLDGIIVAALFAIIAFAAFLIYRVQPAVVTITAPDYYREAPISEDAEIVLDDLTVHIEGGKVWVTDATCGDKTCEHTGKISRAGQSVVCLPNGIVVSVTGKSDLHWEIGR